MAEIVFKIEENLGTLGENAKGWSRELNLVSWNNRDPKYDLRDWSPDHEKMGKGLTLSREELVALRDMLNDINL